MFDSMMQSELRSPKNIYSNGNARDQVVQSPFKLGSKMKRVTSQNYEFGFGKDKTLRQSVGLNNLHGPLS